MDSLISSLQHLNLDGSAHNKIVSAEIINKITTITTINVIGSDDIDFLCSKLGKLELDKTESDNLAQKLSLVIKAMIRKSYCSDVYSDFPDPLPYVY